jgi:denticleless
VGENRDVGGWFWRAHGNAVLDLKWSRNDTHIVSIGNSNTLSISTDLQCS